MELKHAPFGVLLLRWLRLNRTFYGIETRGIEETAKLDFVLIVPFMELKLLSAAALFFFRRVLIVPFMELKLICRFLCAGLGES